VGGSDEVLRMKERAKELHDFVHGLPNLLRKLELQPQQQDGIGKEESKEDLVAVTATTTIDIPKTRHQLSELSGSSEACHWGHPSYIFISLSKYNY